MFQSSVLGSAARTGGTKANRRDNNGAGCRTADAGGVARRNGGVEGFLALSNQTGSVQQDAVSRSAVCSRDLLLRADGRWVFLRVREEGIRISSGEEVHATLKKICERGLRARPVHEPLACRKAHTCVSSDAHRSCFFSPDSRCTGVSFATAIAVNPAWGPRFIGRGILAPSYQERRLGCLAVLVVSVTQHEKVKKTSLRSESTLLQDSRTVGEYRKASAVVF